jgi:threonine/homoserine/homoserine lactone efflux protein
VIDLHLYLAFVLATTILILIPGPNVALIVANSVAWGPRFGLLTVAGTASAMVPQLALTVLGMTELLGTLGVWFEWVRWIGVAYLVWLGVRAWRAPAPDLACTRPEPRAARTIWLRAFLVSLTNPKTLLFYGAFFPQFMTSKADVFGQSLILSATFLALAILLDSTWALAAARARSVLRKGSRVPNRLAGGLLIGAGLGLALARRR